MPPPVLAPARALALAVLVASTPWRAAAADRPTFVEAATRYGLFKTFLGLVAKAGNADALDAGPVTLFMPTDAAFGHLGQAQRDAIAALSPDEAKRFVEHFVIPGVNLTSNDIDPDITAQDGTSYNVTWYGGRLSLRDHRGPATGPLAFVIDGDDPAGRGVIDAVDAVLLPDALARPGAAPAPPVGNGPAQPADVAAAPTNAVPPPPAESRPAAPASSLPAPAAPAPDRSTDDATPGKAADDVAPAKPGGGDVVASGTPKPATPDGPPPAPVAAAPAPPPDATPPPPAAKPAYTLAASDLRDWPVKTTGGPTGKVDRIVMGLPDGRIEGLTATFGGVFGFGGQRAYIAWPLVTLDPDRKVITARMTADELKAAPTGP